ncbi:DUF3570 domain-containing protein [Pseudocolwellia sp. AS88]|uniref:DUF3570 domain-containing protein n=1 Tax=Pseudocolwellia sp. AS88 TaxID=3063958 RepID=UPI0026F2F056|nr:DUF3570 domain-containing protein [Pseudocolwellia sp. AS88]MDO7086545.1 DUF3570 domain-containing protein [Pseudocolwellia sp. AS88]
MQLIDNKKANKNKVNVAQLLTVATCTLLGTTAQAEEQKPWEFDTALMYYGETDRVTASEFILAATKEFEDEHILNLKVTVDVLTGASANGAVPQTEVQTFTRPSGNGSFQTPAKETPLDDTFHDTRVQLNAQWTQPIAKDYRVSGGVHLSKEYDYLSLGLNGNIAHDFNLKNTTLSAGFAYTNDTISPEGGIPIAFEQMLPPVDEIGGGLNRDGSDEDKTTIDLLFGLTQVISRQTIMQFNYSYSQVDGYQTDPFKVVSVVDDNGIAQQQLYENRPDTREKNSIYWQTKYHFLSDSIIDFSYRYFWDDWDITSHTVDARYRLPLGNHYIEPHIRFYTQEAANFYQPFQKGGSALPEYMSADYRVGKMDGITVGVKYGIPMKDNTELSFRLEFFQQSSKSNGDELPGVLNELDLYPSVDAIIAQVNYSF